MRTETHRLSRHTHTHEQRYGSAFASPQQLDEDQCCLLILVAKVMEGASADKSKDVA